MQVMSKKESELWREAVWTKTSRGFEGKCHDDAKF